MDKKLFFREQLMEWGQEDLRPLPWKGIKNPYFIWLSEIILQQTRVEQGLPYYIRFTERFPTIVDLANAEESEVLRLWEGLGYYSRARNLHAAAQMVRDRYQGKFPQSYERIIGLKGVGEYTAAAIASFAYALPYAVLDGNVFRVLARFFGIDTPIDTTPGKKLFKALSQELLDKKLPASYNQHIMDFGATVCKPKQPNCFSCSLSKHCKAMHLDLISLLPVKAKKIQKRTRYFYYIVVEHENQVMLRKREGKDIWLHLYDFPLIETTTPLTLDALRETKDWKAFFEGVPYEFSGCSKIFKQTLSHQKIEAMFIRIKGNEKLKPRHINNICIDWGAIDTFAKPKVITDYLKSQQQSLLF